MLYSFIDSWIKTTGACRYSDGYLFNVLASVKVTSHNACKDFCIQHLDKCDAFDTDGDECFLFNDKDGKKKENDGGEAEKKGKEEEVLKQTSFSFCPKVRDLAGGALLRLNLPFYFRDKVLSNQNDQEQDVAKTAPGWKTP